MPLVRFLEHGQVTIPKQFRDALGLKKGDVAEAELLDDGRIVLVPKRLVREKAWNDLASLFQALRERSGDMSEEDVLEDVIRAVEEYRAKKHAQGNAGRAR
jgi:AbrB family looped-hinge helix DNA binding protein